MYRMKMMFEGFLCYYITIIINVVIFIIVVCVDICWSLTRITTL